MDPVVAAEAGVARDNHACADPGTGTDLYVLVNDCVGSDLDVGSELRVRMDDGSRVNEHLTVARSAVVRLLRSLCRSSQTSRGAKF